MMLIILVSMELLYIVMMMSVIIVYRMWCVICFGVNMCIMM